MPLFRNFKRLPLTRQVTLEKIFDNEKDELIVWFYTYIEKNVKDDSQPNVRIAFRKVLSNGLSDEIVYKIAPITALGQLRIGTIWKSGHCQSQMVFKTEDFVVNFSSGGWRHAAFCNGSSPYPWADYPLSGYVSNDKNQFLEFDTSDKRRLVIPCLEFFYRCYGRSAEVKRVITTYPWHGADKLQENRLYAELGEPEEAGKWKVKLKKRLVLDDVLLLAHAKYDSYTEGVLKYISSQIVAGYDQRTLPYIFLKIQPWHQGKATLRVRGIELTNGDFLALQIVGCSEPEGDLIQRDKERSKQSFGLNNDILENGDHVNGNVRWLNNTPHIVDLTGDEAPDHGSGSMEILDTEFEVIGERRVVIDVRRDQAKTGSKCSATKSSKLPTVVSGGEPYGTGKGVGEASIFANQVMESQGILRDMWNAMLYLQRVKPEKLLSVEWFTPNSGFSADIEPQLIALPIFKDEDKSIDTKTRNWLYLDVQKKVPRGILVAKLVIGLKIVYVLEIQRRTRQRQKNNGTVYAEESFKGLVFILKDDRELENVLTTLLNELRLVHGIFSKMTGKLPEKALAFSHKLSSDNKMICESVVVNALSKMGISLENSPD